MEQTIYSSELTGQSNNVYFRIEARDDEPFLRIAWIGFINEERAKNGLMLELKAMKETKRTSLLVDNRKQQGPFPKEINRWMLENVVPQVADLGGAKSAQILSENFFTELSAKKLANDEAINDQQVINLANFANEEEAMRWLLN